MPFLRSMSDLMQRQHPTQGQHGNRPSLLDAARRELSAQQFGRLERALDEDIGLWDAWVSGQNRDWLFFQIDAASAAAYTITIDPGTRKPLCNCPDGTRNRTADGVPLICKHVCWLVVAVFGLDSLHYFFNGMQLPEERVKSLLDNETERAALIREWSRVETDTESYEDSESDEDEAVRPPSIEHLDLPRDRSLLWPPPFMPGTGERAGMAALPDPDCPICYEVMTDTTERVLHCHRCKHVFTADCIEKWFLQGKNTCPLCRCTGTSLAARAGLL